MNSDILIKELKYLRDEEFNNPNCLGCNCEMAEMDIVTQNIQEPESGMYECQECIAWARVRDTTRMTEMFK